LTDLILPKTLSILLTNKCNFRCNYCEFDCTSKGTSLEISLLEKALRQGRQLGIRRVIYDGGEPMLHEQLETVLQLSRKYGYQIGFVTNAWFIPEKFDMLRKYGAYDFWIGIDGMDKETNDRLRGMPGSFQRIMQSIELIKKNNMFAALNFIVLKENYHQVKDLLEFAVHKRLNGLQVIPLNKYVGRAYSNKVQPLSLDEEASVRNLVRQFGELKDMQTNIGYASDERSVGKCKYLGFDQLCIDWNGNVLLCALATESNMPGIGFPSLRKCNLIDALMKLKAMNESFVKIREQQFPNWRPEEKYSYCGFCLEKLRVDQACLSTSPQKFKNFDGDLLLTTACPVECDFCVYSCSPNGEWMPETTVERVAQEYSKNEIGIRICGGEPFYDLEKLRKCIEIVLKYQKPHEVLLITSGFFGSDQEQTLRALKLLRQNNLDTLVVSLDRWHLKRVPLSSIVRIIEEAKKQDIKIILRVTMDEKSYELMDQVAEIIVNHDLKVEPHECYGIFGKAELLDQSLRDNAEKRMRHFKDKVLGLAAEHGKPQEFKFYELQSPKRSQHSFAARFYATTFPNGNVYADSQCCKGSFMGNINNESLSSMMDRFSKTLPGYILLSERSNCDRRMPALVPGETCDYCRNQPIVEEMPVECIGRQYLVLSPKEDMALRLNKVKNSRELLLAFKLEEDDLNSQTGKKILDLLKSLKQDKRRFKISRPLPRCLFGADHSIVIDKFHFPRDCFECNELFTVNDEEIMSCDNKKGPKIYDMEDRKKIHEYFNALRLTKKPSEHCESCVYLIRKQCDGLCFRQ